MGVRLPQLRLYRRTRRPKLQHERLAWDLHHHTPRPITLQPCHGSKSRRHECLQRPTLRCAARNPDLNPKSKLAEIFIWTLSTSIRLKQGIYAPGGSPSSLAYSPNSFTSRHQSFQGRSACPWFCVQASLLSRSERK
jgi:hypothetical protein